MSIFFQKRVVGKQLHRLFVNNVQCEQREVMVRGSCGTFGGESRLYEIGTWAPAGLVNDQFFSWDGKTPYQKRRMSFEWVPITPFWSTPEAAWKDAKKRILETL